MKLFECQHCGQALYFENVRCESCGMSLGYLPGRETITALEPVNNAWKALAEPKALYRSCSNTQHGVCNWLIPANSPDAFCLACRHNRTIPDLSLPDNLANWQRIEIAKHRLFYTLLRLRLAARDQGARPRGACVRLSGEPFRRLASVGAGHDGS